MPNRFGRLIERLTKSEQEDRLDFGIVLVELTQIQETLAGFSLSVSVLAEELMHRVADGTNYIWDNDADVATTHLSGGVLRCRGDELSGKIELTFCWDDTGDRDRKGISDQLKSITSYACRRLSDLGWIYLTKSSVSSSAVQLHFEIDGAKLPAVLSESFQRSRV